MVARLNFVDGHDPRNIENGVLSRYPIVHICSNRHVKNKDGVSYLFSRDCLEIDIDVDGKILTLYVNHFTSASKGRDKTRDRRLAQSAYVAKLVDKRWKNRDYQGNFIVLGDLNDWDDEHTSLNPLLKHPYLENVINRLDPDDRWTHYCQKKDEYRQMDYILISKTLSELNPSVKPKILRKGMPYRVKKYNGPRYNSVGQNEPKASDHAIVYIDLILS